jgi:hypothetical protein
MGGDGSLLRRPRHEGYRPFQRGRREPSRRRAAPRRHPALRTFPPPERIRGPPSTPEELAFLKEPGAPPSPDARNPGRRPLSRVGRAPAVHGGIPLRRLTDDLAGGGD